VLSYQLSAGVGAKKRDFPGPHQNPPFFRMTQSPTFFSSFSPTLTIPQFDFYIIQNGTGQGMSTQLRRVWL
jgi:hypothetical protein